MGSVFLLVILLLPQYVLALVTMFQTRDLYAFYRELARRRKENPDLVESYRHLREHGNSFAIVFLEFALGVILFSIGTSTTGLSRWFGGESGAISGYLFVGFLWITPAALVWLIGTALERQFLDNPP